MGHDRFAQGVKNLCAPLQQLGNILALLNKIRSGEERLEKVEIRKRAAYTPYASHLAHAS
jgi:hypothetical protein